MKYDVIIAGAGFAGLAVASQLKANVLLLDRYDLGTHQISACGTLVKTMQKIYCEKAILQTFDSIALHTRDRKIDIPLKDSFCTIDYKKFCQLFYAQSHAELKKASVQNVENHVIKTDIGEFESDIIIDATGWQATLASSLKKDYVDSHKLSCGLETEIDYMTDNQLHFFLNAELYKNGVAWLFPAGNKARFGVASYEPDSALCAKLYDFVEKQYQLKVGSIHGGCFCYCCKTPVVEDLFVVGCASGQTLPLTGEGIRRSIEFGLYCGDLIQKILDGELTKQEALKQFKSYAMKTQRQYNFLVKLQQKLPHLTNRQINWIGKLLSYKLISNFVWKWYEKI